MPKKSQDTGRPNHRKPEERTGPKPRRSQELDVSPAHAHSSAKDPPHPSGSQHHHEDEKRSEEPSQDPGRNGIARTADKEPSQGNTGNARIGNDAPREVAPSGDH